MYSQNTQGLDCFEELTDGEHFVAEYQRNPVEEETGMPGEWKLKSLDFTQPLLLEKENNCTQTTTTTGTFSEHVLARDDLCEFLDNFLGKQIMWHGHYDFIFKPKGNNVPHTYNK